MTSGEARRANLRLRNAARVFTRLSHHYTQHMAGGNPEGRTPTSVELERARSEWNDALRDFHRIVRDMFPRQIRQNLANLADALLSFPPQPVGIYKGDDDDYVPRFHGIDDDCFQAVMNLFAINLTMRHTVDAIMLLVGYSQSHADDFDVSPVLIMDYLLMIAMLNGATTTIGNLISMGADFSRALLHEDFMTPFHALFGAYIQSEVKVTVLMYLHEHHGEMFQRALDTQDEGGWTALMYAAEREHWDVFIALLNLGADPFLIQFWNPDTRKDYGSRAEYLDTLTVYSLLSTHFNRGEFERFAYNLLSSVWDDMYGPDPTDNMANEHEPVARDDRPGDVEFRDHVNPDLVIATNITLALSDARDPPDWMAGVVEQFRQHAMDARVI